MKKNVMDKENYNKARLLESLNSLVIAIEDGDDNDTLDLLASHIIQEINTKKPFIKDDRGNNVCSFCKAVHVKHLVKFSRFHLNLITKIFNHVVKTGNYNFNKSDLELSRTEYGNFYQLQRFGLLFFNLDENGKRVKGGSWGIPLKRVAWFLRGENKVSKFYVRDKQFKQNIPSEEKITVHQVPKATNEFTNEIPDFVSYENLWNN